MIANSIRQRLPVQGQAEVWRSAIEEAYSMGRHFEMTNLLAEEVRRGERPAGSAEVAMCRATVLEANLKLDWLLQNIGVVARPQDSQLVFNPSEGFDFTCPPQHGMRFFLDLTWDVADWEYQTTNDLYKILETCFQVGLMHATSIITDRSPAEDQVLCDLLNHLNDHLEMVAFGWEVALTLDMFACRPGRSFIDVNVNPIPGWRGSTHVFLRL
jgi:hypothetical protein